MATVVLRRPAVHRPPGCVLPHRPGRKPRPARRAASASGAAMGPGRHHLLARQQLQQSTGRLLDRTFRSRCRCPSLSCFTAVPPRGRNRGWSPSASSVREPLLKASRWTSPARVSCRQPPSTHPRGAPPSRRRASSMSEQHAPSRTTSAPGWPSGVRTPTPWRGWARAASRPDGPRGRRPGWGRPASPAPAPTSPASRCRRSPAAGPRSCAAGSTWRTAQGSWPSSPPNWAACASTPPANWPLV